MSYFLILLPITKIFSKMKWKPCAFQVTPREFPRCRWDEKNLGLPWQPKAKPGPDSLEQWQAPGPELLTFSHQQRANMKKPHISCAILLFNLRQEVKELVSRRSEAPSLPLVVLIHLWGSSLILHWKEGYKGTALQSYKRCHSLELFCHLFPALKSMEQLQVEMPGEM